MKTLNNNSRKMALASVATLFALSAAVTEANPYGHGYMAPKIGYTNSFNSLTTNKAKTDIDNSRHMKRDYRLDYNVDNSTRSRVANDYRLNLKYDNRKDKINAKQSLKQHRVYSSGVSQSGFNAGSATGHSLQQKQGGTRVGSLVSESRTSIHKGDNFLSPNNSIRYGDTSTGNMMYSHIGGIQSGVQGGDTTNLQSNKQTQDATSSVSSTDSVANTASK